jgi:demethylmenaquinone methyltransferase/2-methoxy-6-polyprenyl-1,4-benzoquinol methylase
MATTSTENAPWKLQGAEKRDTLRDMFGGIADRYDLINSLISFRMHRRWRKFSVSKLQLKPGDSALDLCCGTGDFIVPLRNAVGSQGKVVGVDYCEPMLDVAAKKVGKKGLAIGDACAMPFADKSFNGITVGWGLRNLDDIETGLRESVRVLKFGGGLVSLDMAMPTNRGARFISRIAHRRALPMIGALFGRKEAYTYLPKSTESFFSQEELASLLLNAGLRNVGWKNLYFGNICVMWGFKI